ncbi:hypothetical protein ACH427_09585 [Streptomyces sp. NPDC020379]|uniref:hypothetical protein n=1 Tax=Streptomyces sp. NPDC020379 TaxID=3365071 RepID=UPI0037B7E1EF
MTRILAGALGLALMATGVWALLFGTQPQDPVEVAKWLLGVLLVHDGVVVPVTLAVGFALARGPVRGVVRGTLLVGAALTAVSLPVLFRPGPVQNASVLPLNYPLDWAVCVSVTVGVGALAGAVRWWRSSPTLPLPETGDEPPDSGPR